MIPRSCTTRCCSWSTFRTGRVRPQSPQTRRVYHVDFADQSALCWTAVWPARTVVVAAAAKELSPASCARAQHLSRGRPWRSTRQRSSWHLPNTRRALFCERPLALAAWAPRLFPSLCGAPTPNSIASAYQFVSGHGSLRPWSSWRLFTTSWCRWIWDGGLAAADDMIRSSQQTTSPVTLVLQRFRVKARMLTRTSYRWRPKGLQLWV